MMRYIVCFSGASGSGKTTLIEKISQSLISQNKKVSIIKNDPKNKASFDIRGKDSDRFFKTGANTIITSPIKTTLFLQKKMEIKDIIKILDFDYLLIEGHKELDFPRITIFRDKIYNDYIEISSAFACKNLADINVLNDKIKLELDNVESIIKWIEGNSYER